MVKYTLEEAEKFIEHIAPMIVAEGRNRGYKIFSTAIAQAIIEGACGKSALARDYHNHFGMKCGSSWKGASVNMKTKEEYNSQLVSIRDNFRAYPNDPTGIKGYYDFCSSKRYANLKRAKNYKEYAEMLKADGWATSSSYVRTLCNTVIKYNLQRFDDVAVEYFPIVTGYSSIVEALELIGVDSSKAYRRQIWNANFTGTYLYTATQNLQMLNKLAEGNLIKP